MKSISQIENEIEDVQISIAIAQTHLEQYEKTLNLLQRELDIAIAERDDEVFQNEQLQEENDVDYD